MGQISMEKPCPPGSVLSGNQQTAYEYRPYITEPAKMMRAIETMPCNVVMTRHSCVAAD